MKSYYCNIRQQAILHHQGKIKWMGYILCLFPARMTLANICNHFLAFVRFICQSDQHQTQTYCNPQPTKYWFLAPSGAQGVTISNWPSEKTKIECSRQSCASQKAIALWLLVLLIEPKNVLPSMWMGVKKQNLSLTSVPNSNTEEKFCLKWPTLNINKLFTDLESQEPDTMYSLFMSTLHTWSSCPVRVQTCHT